MKTSLFQCNFSPQGFVESPLKTLQVFLDVAYFLDCSFRPGISETIVGINLCLLFHPHIYSVDTILSCIVAYIELIKQIILYVQLCQNNC